MLYRLSHVVETAFICASLILMQLFYHHLSVAILIASFLMFFYAFVICDATLNYCSFVLAVVVQTQREIFLNCDMDHFTQLSRCWRWTGKNWESLWISWKQTLVWVADSEWKQDCSWPSGLELLLNSLHFPYSISFSMNGVRLVNSSRSMMILWVTQLAAVDSSI